MRLISLATFTLLCSTSFLAAAPLGSAFTYQGSLAKAGAPVNEPHDFQFGLYDSAAGTNQIGTTVTRNNVDVTNGIFNVNLNFGHGAFGPEKRFLQIMVRPSGGVYTGLSPRAAIMPAPVALSVAANGVTADSIADGSITPDKLEQSETPKFSAFVSAKLNLTKSAKKFEWFVNYNRGDFAIDDNGNIIIEKAGMYHLSINLSYTADADGRLFSNVWYSRDGMSFRTIVSSYYPNHAGLISRSDIIYLGAGTKLSVMASSNGWSDMHFSAGNQSSLHIVRID